MTVQTLGLFLLKDSTDGAGKTLEGASKFVEAAGKGSLSFITALVLIIAVYFFFAFKRDNVTIRAFAAVVMVLCAFAFVFILLVPHSPKEQPKDQKVQVTTPAQPAQPAPVGPPPPKYLTADPETGIPFMKKIPFHLGDVQTNVKEGGDANTPGNHWEKSFTAPGPVTSATMDADVPYHHTNHCLFEKDVATCTGWINGNNQAERTMTVTWEEKNPAAK
jgi:hypothetical protein